MFVVILGAMAVKEDRRETKIVGALSIAVYFEVLLAPAFHARARYRTILASAFLA